MNAQSPALARKPLNLTLEEAMTLLEMCLFTEASDDSTKSEIMTRVAELCREFMRSNESEAHPVQTFIQNAHGVWQRRTFSSEPPIAAFQMQ